MTMGLIGRKIGMSRIFTETGDTIPVTVVEVLPNVVTQVKSIQSEGYKAIQVTTGKRLASRVNKPEAGHFAKANIEAGAGLWEFRLSDNDTSYEVGQAICADLFEAGQRVDVVGTSKGKGFAGGVKRHNFRTQDATHGNSLAHRVLGSIGQNQTPGRVFKGKKMAGHLGAERCTIQNLEIVRVDKDKSLILIKGAVPGCETGRLIIKPTVKVPARAHDAVTA